MKTIQHPDDYIRALPDERKQALTTLREVIGSNLPKGFLETISYGMIAYVVPHHLYPKGYHCDVKQALPFINLASQKQHIAIYHMGLYANTKLYNWFIAEYKKYSSKKPDMGKSCIRFKKPEHIPYALIAELCKKMTVEDWIQCYENQFMKNKQ